jgi:hypothetical protein
MIDNNILEDAKKVLLNNWRNGYTIPSARLYPFQWNWDSGFIAIGYSYFDQQKAMDEISNMFKGQWQNGMLPHINFHQLNPNYFPGPDVWRTQALSPSNVATSGVTQPSVFGFVLERMHAQMQNNPQWLPFLRDIFPKIVAFHRYLYTHRDPFNEGLVYIHHNWESGTDNSPLWDDAFEKIDVTNAREVSELRRDNKNVDAAERPTNEHYKKYIFLVDLFSKHNYNDEQIFQHTPFAIQDVLFNAMLIKSNKSLIFIGELLGINTEEIAMWNDKSINSMNTKLWDETSGYYLAYDLKSQQQIPCKVSSCFMPLFAGICSEAQAQILVKNLQQQFKKDDWQLCPSCAFTEPSFNPLKYWRGPIWINVNWMLYNGLIQYGYTELAMKIKNDSLALMLNHGWFEYFDPRPTSLYETKKGIGADLFSWSAALYIDFKLNKNHF